MVRFENTDELDVAINICLIFSARSLETPIQRSLATRRKGPSKSMTGFQEKVFEAISPRIRSYCLLDNAYPIVDDKVAAFQTMWDNEMGRLFEAGEESEEMNEAPSEQWMTNAMQVLTSFRGTHASRAKKEVKGLYSLQRYDKKALAGHIRRLRDEDRFLAASQYWNGVDEAQITRSNVRRAEELGSQDDRMAREEAEGGVEDDDMTMDPDGFTQNQNEDDDEDDEGPPRWPRRLN
ncbi:Protein of unknown function [Pyronema omphalodes CBS 100304]|uniref:Uncharacterized protein n=1 Tax=Pyronema omphalodes (strain CBS 100304) TaxID=1076935 RepID=U4LV05_PYROM|nr:Protein of unknown function [Pyronema omphalodes CBS 100304]